MLRKNALLTLVLEAPRVTKRLIVIVLDLSLCIIATWFAYFIRLGKFLSFSEIGAFPFIFSAALLIPLFYGLQLYRNIFRFAGYRNLLSIYRAMTIYAIIYSAVITAFGVDGVPRTLGILQPVLLLLLISTSRTLVVFILDNQNSNTRQKLARSRLLIYGAGRAGRQLAAGLEHNKDFDVIGFVDDDTSLHGNYLNNLPIYGSNNLHNTVNSLSISNIIIAIPSLNRKQRLDIIDRVRHLHVFVQTLPSTNSLIGGNIKNTEVQDLDIDDLLGRDTIAPDVILLAKNITNKIVLVTGAGGSIGSELCRQIVAYKPIKIILIDHSELALYTIHQELLDIISPQSKDILVPIVGSILNANRMDLIFSLWSPNTVYHAAAYKHVPIVEHNIIEGIKNNTIGTLNTALVSIKYKVSDFVLISTDKAVRPTNIMGASKRLAEMVLQALSAEQSATRFSMVRFGNVLDSSGSVVPRFREQIRRGGPVSVTHRDITRYFMTIIEAAQLVLQAGALASGGDVFVLDMGEPIKIYDLAIRMIEMMGLSIKDEYNPDGDIQINIIGLRPGEKLYEELLIGDDPMPTSHQKIMKAHENYIPLDELQHKLNEIVENLEDNKISEAKKIIHTLVDDYPEDSNIVDILYNKAKEPLNNS